MFIPMLFAVGLTQDSLTLDAALAIARAHRGDVVVATAEAQAARADARAAVAIPNPTAAFVYTGDLPHQHLTVDQPFDWLLRRGSLSAAGRAGVDVALADSTQRIARVEREVQIGFYTALGARLRLTLGEEEAGFADSVAQIAARRRAAGEVSELEEAQASLEALRTRSLLSLAREEHVIAMAELGRALGVPTESLPPLSGALDVGITTIAPSLYALADMPVVQRAAADSVLAHALARAMRRTRVPLPSVQTGVEWGNPSDPNARPTVLLGFSLPFPLWQSGGASAASANARARASAAALTETRADAARAVAQTAARVAESGRRALVARDSIMPLAARQRELALVMYSAGETGLVPVLDALRAEREVLREAVAVLVAHQAARADWQALMGEIR